MKKIDICEKRSSANDQAQVLSTILDKKVT